MRKQALIHFIVWIAFVCLFIVQAYWSTDHFPLRFGMLLMINIALFYLNYLVLVPQFLLQKKINQYILFVTVGLLVTVLLRGFSSPEMPPEFVQDQRFNSMPPPPLFFDIFRFIFPVIISLAFIVIGTAIKMYEEWNRNERDKKDIESYKTRTELHYLKNQLSPHFLFNSLNSIYSLTTKKSDDAPEAVITLSELMRYMLYQTDNDFVSLKDELDYIQNYLKLQRLRIANNENITLNIHGNITNQKIRPLLLISFIENAFKYGTDFKGNTEVRIIINIAHEYLEFKCINLIGNRKRDVDNSGIGLQNTKDRIELLYRDKHELKVYEEDHKFVVYLKLKLN
ncbi:MAG: sensor histidine kinase [Leeuwenhoekiella sp.]